ncbi:MAG: Bpu10I family restriction endonuclease, partial [Candidatus Competibacter sp.]
MSSNVRQEYRDSDSRRVGQEYADFIDKSQYSADVFQRMIDKIQIVIDNTSPDIDKVIERGY